MRDPILKNKEKQPNTEHVNEILKNKFYEYSLTMCNFKCQ